jgi:hypothetical protein
LESESEETIECLLDFLALEVHPELFDLDIGDFGFEVFD